MITALAIALTLAAPGDTLIRTGGGKLIPAIDGGWASPLMVIPFNKTGPLITEDANTVTHVYFDGSQLVDTQANLGWHLDIGVNAPTQNVTSPFYPDGFASAMKRGAGPFSDSDNYYHGTSSVLAAGSDFMACVVYRGGATGSTMINDTRALASGWRIILGGTTAGLTSQVAGCSALATVSASAINVLCVGRSGTTGYAQVNGGTVVTDATCAALDTCGGGVCDQRIGPKSGDGTWPGVLYEFYWTSTAWNATTAAQIQARVLGQYATDAAGTATTPLTVTRSSSATYEQPAGTLWTAPANVLRVNASGALIEPTSGNLTLWSEAFDNVAWARVVSGAASAPTIDATNVAGPFSNYSTAERVTFTVNGSGIYDCSILSSSGTTGSTTAITASVWMRTADNSTQTIWIGLSVPGSYVYYGTPGTFTVNGAWQRFDYSYSHTSATGRSMFIGWCGSAKTAQLELWGAQLYSNVGIATSYIPTTTTSATRAADAVTLTFTPDPGLASRLCMEWKGKVSSSIRGGVEAHWWFMGPSGFNAGFTGLRTTPLSIGASQNQQMVAQFAPGGYTPESDHDYRVNFTPLSNGVKVFYDGTTGGSSGGGAPINGSLSPLTIGNHVTADFMNYWLAIYGMKLYTTTCDKVKYP